MSSNNYTSLNGVTYGTKIYLNIKEKSKKNKDIEPYKTLTIII